MAIKTKTATTIEEDEFVGEIFIEIKALVIQFIELCQNEIAKIFSNQFKPINLYKLCFIKSWDYFYRDQIYINENILKMYKITRFYKNYDISNTF